MSILYVTESGCKINVDSNYVCVAYKSGMTKKIPIETLESISIFGMSQITTQCSIELLKRGIPVSYYSKNGSYFGRFESTGHIHVERQRKQALLYNTEFAIDLAKKIIDAKINNQKIVLKRYARDRKINIEEEVSMMNYNLKNIEKCNSIDQIIGHEGIAARYYFNGLSKLVDSEFKFNGRSRRPPKDEFNSLLSLGYSIVMNEIYGKIQNKGLNPYFGFIHQDKEKHPTLASDLMEEWRPVIVDSVVMSLINGHEIYKENFYRDDESGGYFLTNEGMKIFINKMENKMRTDTRYLEYLDYSVSFRKAMDHQVNQLAKAIEDNDVGLYYPLKIR